MDSDFATQLAGLATDVGALSAACLRMDSPFLRRRVAENNRLVAAWMEQGGHAEMEYLERMYADKSTPWQTFPFARSIIVLTFSNLWGNTLAAHPFPTPVADAPVGFISAYAREHDYHHTGQRMLAELAQALGNLGQIEAVVDTGAVYERLLAEVGGLGVIGANTLLRSAGAGTRSFIGCLFVERELEEVIHNAQMPFSCDSCLACLNNCPTGAIGRGRAIDAGRCISYLTMEKPGVLSLQEAAALGDWVFGCDDCTSVCPPLLREDMRIPVDLDWLFRSSAGEVRRTIKGNASAYAGVTKLRRNAVAVLNNMQTPQAEELLDWIAVNSGSAVVVEQLKLLRS